MKIYRDNLVIELTEDEIDKAYRERKAYYHREDLIHKIKSYCDEEDWEDEIFRPDEDMIEIGETKISVADLQRKIDDPVFMDNLERKFQKALDFNGSYWESYWLTAKAVIEDVMK